MMEKRNYPAERKLAPTWICPVCNKNMSSRGKIGHLEKAHGRGKPLKENDPYPFIKRELVKKKRPLSRHDMRALITNVLSIMIETTRTPNVVAFRKALSQCEYLIREVEINANCTLEEAWAKFPIQKSELDLYN